MVIPYQVMAYRSLISIVGLDNSEVGRLFEMADHFFDVWVNHVCEHLLSGYKEGRAGE